MSVSPIAPVNAGSPSRAVAAPGDAAPTMTTATPVESAVAPGPPPSQSAAVPNPNELAVNLARAEAAARQGSLAPLLADLAQAFSILTLPKEVKAAIAEVLALQTPTDEPVTTQTIKGAVAQSGLFLEAHLAGPTPFGGTTPDLKAALLVLQNALAAVTPDPGSVEPEPAPSLPSPRQSVPAPTRAQIHTNTPSNIGGSTAPAVSTMLAAPPDAATLSLPQAGPTPPQAQAAPALLESAPAARTPGEAVAPAGSVAERDVAPATSVPETTIPQAQALHAQVGSTNLAESLASPTSGVPPPQGTPGVSANPATPAVPASSVISAVPTVPAIEVTGIIPDAVSSVSLTPLAPAKAAIVQASALPTTPTGSVQYAVEEATIPQAAVSPQAGPTQLVPRPQEPTADMSAALLILQGAAAAVPTGRPMAPSRSTAPPPLRQNATIAQAAGPAVLPAGDEATVAQHLAGETGQALARLTLHQLASLPDQTSGPAWIFELPLLTPQGATMAQFVIDHDAEAATGEPGSAQAWRTRFSIDVEPLGPVHVHLRIGQESSAVTIWAERTGAVERLRSQGTALAQALSAEVAIHPGTPRRSAPMPGPGQFIDQSS